MINYKIDFIKIDKNNVIAGVGTAGNIWIVLNALLNIQDNDRIYVDMSKEKTINTEDRLINNSNNPWDYYFHQIDKPVNCDNLLDSVNIHSKISYHARYTHADSLSKRVREKFFNNFKLRDDLQNEINSFYVNKIEGINTLGVQVRLTDMASSHNVKALSEYVEKINRIINKDKSIEQLFLATDDECVIEKFVEKFNIPVVYLQNIYRATDAKPDLLPYDRYEYTRPMHRYHLGREVIIDIFLLASCNQILKADISCVSHLAVFFSDKIEKTHFLSTKFEFISGKVIDKLNHIIKRLVDV